MMGISINEKNTFAMCPFFRITHATDKSDKILIIIMIVTKILDFDMKPFSHHFEIG